MNRLPLPPRLSRLPRLARLAAAIALPLAASCGSPPPAVAPIAPAPSSAAAAPQTTVVVEAPTEDDLAVPIGKNDPTWGSRKAYVTIVVFSDFQCPFCARLAPTLSALREKYGPDQLRIVWKNEPLPFHDRAKPTAEAGQGVFEIGGNEAFWKFHDKVFQNQANLSDEALEQYAEASGIHMSRFRRGMATHAWEPKVSADHEQSKRVGVDGTPTMVINGRLLGGAQPLERIAAMVDEELAKAKAQEGSGTPREKIYAVVSQANFAARPKKEPVDEEEDEDTKTVHKIPVTGSPVRGSATALVTILEFSDFQCPYCKRVEDSLKRVQSTYGDSVRLVWKHEPLPFHPRAMPAAMLAAEARAQKGDKGFWDVHDALFASQPKLEDADLEEIAKGAGLNVPKALTAIKTEAHRALIQRDMDLADDFKASGTPHFFINGRRLVGAQPFEKFAKIIDEEIAKAKALLAKGTAPAALYDALVRDGVPAAEPDTKTVGSLPAGAPSKGPTGATVVVQEFADFQCPFCVRAEATMAEILKAYPEKVRVVWRDLPLPMHADAPLAAEAARAARAQRGDAGFWKMHDRLLGEKGPDALKRDALDRYAREMGLDMTKWADALDNHTYKAPVDAEVRAASDLAISGTPAFLVTTPKGTQAYFISGAQPFAKFKKVIDRTLKEGAPKAKPPSAANDAKASGAKVTVNDAVVGKGAEAHGGDTLVVHYVGTLADGGNKFDSSRDRNQPFRFSLGRGQVIRGWDQGLVGMRIGGRRQLTVPPELAYGKLGSPPAIPPNATLKFDVELLRIE